jgi:hypothetical protein
MENIEDAPWIPLRDGWSARYGGYNRYGDSGSQYRHTDGRIVESFPDELISPERPVPRARAAPTPRRSLANLTLPADAELRCHVNGTLHTARWNPATHSFRDTTGRVWTAPSPWLEALGKHCNGWDHVYAANDRGVSVTIGTIYNQQNRRR